MFSDCYKRAIPQGLWSKAYAKSIYGLLKGDQIVITHYPKTLHFINISRVRFLRFSVPTPQSTPDTSIIPPHNFVVRDNSLPLSPRVCRGGGYFLLPERERERGVVSRVISSPWGLSVPRLCLPINPGSTNSCMKLSRIFGFGRIELQMIVTSRVRSGFDGNVAGCGCVEWESVLGTQDKTPSDCS